MNIAILGFDEAGKRTLFALLTGRHVHDGAADERIDGVAPIRDPRVDAISNLCKPERRRYAETMFSLCPHVEVGSDKRLWLEAARSCDALCVVVRDFSDPSVYHAKGSVDAARDRRDLEAELGLADLEMVEKRLDRLRKEKRGGPSPAQVIEEKALGYCQKQLEDGKMLRDASIDKNELAAIHALGLLTLKPVIWTFNVDEARVSERRADGALNVACKIEEEIAGIADAGERGQYLESLGLAQPGVDRMSAAIYDAMGLMSFYTMGPDECRAWTIRKGSTAPEAAGKVHSDMERGFIRVEVIKYDDLLSAGSETAVRQQGKLSLRGRDYVMEDGDICHFLFNV